MSESPVITPNPTTLSCSRTFSLLSMSSGFRFCQGPACWQPTTEHSKGPLLTYV